MFAGWVVAFVCGCCDTLRVVLACLTCCFGAECVYSGRCVSDLLHVGLFALVMLDWYDLVWLLVFWFVWLLCWGGLVGRFCLLFKVMW